MKTHFAQKALVSLAQIGLFILITIEVSTGQAVSINESGMSANAKSILDVSSTTKGLLVPRMTTMQRTGIAPGMTESGMIVYDTDLNRYMFFNGTSWARVGEGYWMEAGVGIQNAISHVGIGGLPATDRALNVLGGVGLGAHISNSGATDQFALKVINSVGTGVAAFSGSSILGYPSISTALYGRGSDGALGGYIISEGSGTALLAQSQGTGVALDAYAFGTGMAATLRGGNVYVEEKLGIGVNPPGAPLHVYTSTSEVARFAGADNTLMSFYNNGVYDGFIQTYEGDFYFGKTLGSGQVVLFNQATSHLEIDPQGDVSIGVAGPVANRLRVESASQSAVISSEVNYVGNSDVRAVEGVSTPAPGYGYGGHFTGGYRGVYGFANATTYTGEAVALYGFATGTAGTRIGVLGVASGGTTNWAGYFSSGNVYVTNDLRLGDLGGAVGYKLSVNGKIICEELKVQDSAAWPDYVFGNDYDLMSISELDKHIQMNRRLPGIPSAEEIEQDGLMIGDMQRRMMEKIEELTLYIIAQDKRISELESKLASQH